MKWRAPQIQSNQSHAYIYFSTHIILCFKIHFRFNEDLRRIKMTFHDSNYKSCAASLISLWWFDVIHHITILSTTLCILSYNVISYYIVSWHITQISCYHNKSHFTTQTYYQTMISYKIYVKAVIKLSYQQNHRLKCMDRKWLNKIIFNEAILKSIEVNRIVILLQLINKLIIKLIIKFMDKIHK